MNETMQIGIFGPRGEGKTTVLAALQALRDGNGLSLTTLDKETMRYLRPLAEGLKQGKFPPATPPNRPRILRWQAHVGKRSWRLEGNEFAGEFTDPIWKAGPEEFTRHLDKWTSASNGLLLFVDCTRGDDVPYMDAIDKLMRGLLQHRVRHGGERRALAVVMTKADELPGATPQNLADSDTVERLLQGHSILQLIKQHLDRLGSTVHYRVFLTSAVGWQFSRSPEAQRHLQPCNLFAPLRWVIEQAAELVHQDRNRRRLSMLYTLALVFVLLASLWYLIHQHRENTYARYHQFVKERPFDAEAVERLAFYNDHIAGWPLEGLWGLRESRQTADQQAEEDRRIVARLEAEAAFAVLQDADGPLRRQGKHPLRHAAAQSYLQRHGDSAPEGCLQSVREILDSTRNAWQKERTEWESVRAMSTARLADQEAKIAALRRYASGNDSLDGEEALRLAAQVDEQRTNVLVRDRQAWEAARDLVLEHPSHYAAKRQTLKAYADQPDAQFRTRALALIRLLDQQEPADRCAYRALAAASQQATTSGAIEALEKQAQAYLADSEHARTMRATVMHFLRDLDDFKKPRSVQITAGRISTPEGFSDNSRGNPRLQLTLSIGNQSYVNCSPVVTQNSGVRFIGSVNATYGPFSITWGIRQTLTLTVRVKRTFPGLFTEETATESISDSVYLLNHANGTVRLSTVAGPIEIELQCPDARPPVLPVYGLD